MGKIHVLPPSIAERIAAGEVIERPASVVKELVENSLDAQATEVCVALEDGGKNLIEITDNGRGMDADDLSICIKRHATSKLRDLSDLENIRTLGFRGEALPSVAAVANLSILSRAETSPDEATAYEIRPETTEPASVTFGHFLGSAHGTRIRVEALFSQIPARLKFLKAQAAEVAQVREWIERLALTHPHVGFRLLSNNRTVLDLRPQSETDRIRAILADGEDYPLVSHSSEDDFLEGLKLRAHWLQGLSTPQTRKLIQIVNKRAVRDRMLQQATLSAFRQALLPGQFPAVVLFVEIEPKLVDVNVHPTKTELRFLESGKIFRAIQTLLDSLIAKHGVQAFAAAAPTSENTPAATSDSPFIRQPLSTTWRAAGPSQPAWDFTKTALPPSHSPTGPTAETKSEVETPRAAWPFEPARFVGVLFSTYLLYDLGEEAALIDQHAAHERVRYEKLKRRFSGNEAPLSPQQLLIPEAIHFDEEQRPALEAKLQSLNTLGFDAELFGESAVLIRAVPAEWGTDNLRIRLKGLIERLVEKTTESSSLLMDESLFESLASEACHSAIRANDRIDRQAALTLVEDLSRCDHPWNCPHGRPTVARVPRARFEEWFLRRV